MSLLRYLKPMNGVPDPKGPLSSSIPSYVIAEANTRVQEAEKSRKKRGPYRSYSPTLRLEIGKYSSQHGVAAASRYFTRKLKKSVSVTTIRSIRDAYRKELKLRRKRTPDLGDVELESLDPKKRGRPLLLGNYYDGIIQLYVRMLREAGGSISASLVVAAATGILMTSNRGMLVEFGGHVQLNKYWARSLLQRMNFVQRKATTAKSKHTGVNLRALKTRFLTDFHSTVSMEEIPPELVLNWDQTGIQLVPSSSWTMDRCGVKRVEIIGANDKRQITAIFCGTIMGDFLPFQVIYQGKTARSHPKYQFPGDWDITHSPKHWSTEETMVEYIENIVVPYVEKVRDDLDTPEKAALVVMDNFKGQVTSKVTALLERHNIHTCLLPPNTTDVMQPMDISVNKSAKAFLKNKFEAWYASEVMKQFKGKEVQDLEGMDFQPIDMSMQVIKEVGAPWLVELYEYMHENPDIVVNGFVKSGMSKAMDGLIDSDLELQEEQESDSDMEDDEDIQEYEYDSDSLGH